MKICNCLFLIILYISPLFLKSQNITIQVKVIDKEKQGIPGASVIIVNKKEGTVTDADGFFTLQVSPEDILLINAVDMFDKKVQVSTIIDKKDGEISLEEDQQEVCYVITTICEVRVPEKDRIKNLTFWDRIKEKIIKL
jgi:CarboxypepD_reg-like domain